MAQNPNEQLVIPEDLKEQVQEYSIRANSFDVSKRDYQVEVGKTLQALIRKINVQDKAIKDLTQELANYKNAATDVKPQ